MTICSRRSRVSARDTGAGADARVVAFAVIGPAAAVVRTDRQRPTVRRVGTVLAGAGTAKADVVAFAVVGPAARIVAQLRPDLGGHRIHQPLPGRGFVAAVVGVGAALAGAGTAETRLVAFVVVGPAAGIGLGQRGPRNGDQKGCRQDRGKSEGKVFGQMHGKPPGHRMQGTAPRAGSARGAVQVVSARGPSPTAARRW